MNNNDLKDKLLLACVGHTHGVIMSALVMVTGGMVAKNCGKNRKAADQMIKIAANGMHSVVDIVLMSPHEYDA